ncbi:hypothetical protein HK101_005553 [Irineochytrium annulatum]|nr:hypothetical protein HK101_005553 [Irineochytrium annulatum]
MAYLQLRFAVIQTVFTTLICTLVFHFRPALPYILPPKRKWPYKLPMLILAALLVTGVWCLYLGPKLFYLGALLTWTSPVLILQWAVAGTYLGNRWVECVTIILSSTAYLCWVDWSAIRAGVWTIHGNMTTGIMVDPGTWSLPLEEALFFLLVNCMIVGGWGAIDRTLAVIRCFHSRVGGRRGVVTVKKEHQPLDGDKAKPEKPAVKMPLIERQPSAVGLYAHLWDDASYILSSILISESLLDNQTILDARSVSNLIRNGSRTFNLASILFPTAVREDVHALYAFCRVADDLVDRPFRSPARDTRAHALAVLDRFLTSCYGDHQTSLDWDEVERSVRIECGLDSGKVETEVLPSLRRFARLIPRRVPERCARELLEALRWDVEARRVTDEASLIRYCQLAAGSVGEAMVWLLVGRDAVIDGASEDGSMLFGKDGGCGAINADMIQRARDMGVALQLVNMARDVGEDAGTLGRIYAPEGWLDVMATAEKVEGCGEAMRRQLIRDPWARRPMLANIARKFLQTADVHVASAKLGVGLMPPRYQRAIWVALEMYLEIGTIIREATDYPNRATVLLWQKIWIILNKLILSA